MNSLRIKRVDEDEDVTCVRVDGRVAPETLASEGEPLGQIYGPQIYGRRLLMSMACVDYLNSNGRVWQSITPWQVELAWWLAELADNTPLHPEPAEVESIHWHTPAEIALLPELLESNHHFLAALATGEIVLE